MQCVAVNYGEDIWHERLLLERVGGVVWIVCTPDGDVYEEELAVPPLDGLRTLGPNREPPVGVPPGLLYVTHPWWTHEELARLVGEGQRLALESRQLRGAEPDGRGRRWRMSKKAPDAILGLPPPLRVAFPALPDRGMEPPAAADAPEAARGSLLPPAPGTPPFEPRDGLGGEGPPARRGNREAGRGSAAARRGWRLVEASHGLAAGAAVPLGTLVKSVGDRGVAEFGPGEGVFVAWVEVGEEVPFLERELRGPATPRGDLLGLPPPPSDSSSDEGGGHDPEAAAGSAGRAAGARRRKKMQEPMTTTGDLRIVPVSYSAAGERHRDYRAGVDLVVEHAFKDFVVKGPRTAKFVAEFIGRSGKLPTQRHEWWVNHCHLKPGDVGVESHELISRALEAAICYDGLNVGDLACFEVLAREYQLVEEMHKHVLLEAQLGKADAKFLVEHEERLDYLGGSAVESGICMSPKLLKYVATRSEQRYRLDKNRVKAREAREQARKGKK